MLAPSALQDQVFSIRLGGWPIVAVPESLVGDGASRRMMAALSLMDVFEQLLALVGVDAALKDSRDTSAVQFLIDDGEGLGSALDLSCLYFVFGQRTMAQVAKVRLGPGGSCRVARTLCTIATIS